MAQFTITASPTTVAAAGLESAKVTNIGTVDVIVGPAMTRLRPGQPIVIAPVSLDVNVTLFNSNSASGAVEVTTTSSTATGLVAWAAHPAFSSKYVPIPTGTPTTGQAPVVATSSPLGFGWGSTGGGGGDSVITGVVNEGVTPESPGIYLVRPAEAVADPWPALPTILRKWTGDSTGGTDNAFSTQAGTLTSLATGSRSPRLQCAAPSATSSISNWGALGSFAAWTIAFDIEFQAIPGAAAQLIAPLTGSGGASWRLDVTSAGLLQLRDSTVTTRATSSVALTAGTGYRLEIYGDADSNTVDVYPRGNNSPSSRIDRLTYAATAAFGNINNFRFGVISGVTGGVTYFIDSIFVAQSKVSGVGDWVTRV